MNERCSGRLPESPLIHSKRLFGGVFNASIFERLSKIEKEI